MIFPISSFKYLIKRTLDGKKCSIYSKFLICFVFWSSSCFFYFAYAEKFQNKFKYIEQIESCLKFEQLKSCAGIIAKLEFRQLQEYDNANFRCQSSLLGVQTDLIKKIYFDEYINKPMIESIPYVIKNC